jgi:hypothetical protein
MRLFTGIDLCPVEHLKVTFITPNTILSLVKYNLTRQKMIITDTTDIINLCEMCHQITSAKGALKSLHFGPATYLN